MEKTDELFQLRNLFYVGSYQAVINEENSLNVKSDALRLEKDVFVYRAYIARGDYSTVIESVSDSSEPSLLAVKALAQYFSSSDKTSAIESLTQLTSSADPTVLLLAAIMFTNEREFEKALGLLSQTPSTFLEARALSAQIYLLHNRPDFSGYKKEFKILKDTEEAVISQLAVVWDNLYQANVAGCSKNPAAANSADEKIEEAFSSLTELVQRYSETPLLLNALAACSLMRSQTKDSVNQEMKLAEKRIGTSLDKDPNKEETLVNQLACQILTNKTGETSFQRNLRRVKLNENSSYVKKLNEVEAKFDQLAADILASNNVVSAN
eukprot:TRINITY_DN5648_c0_g1_i2.p1 TRINITY_DN5648_c0_g1~~TRINITY_DN5648_c0_g1_i2.p1  ORF type:complete len:324 (+),score=80.69 TRINITY_DN5648_c0_g1_i2:57-1028(+)